MTSKIINMAEQIKDAEDRLLESMFASEPIADDGFSKRVVKQVRRRMWLRRVTLPVAALIGLTIAFKPVAGLVTLISQVVQGLPDGMVASATASLPTVQLIITGALIMLVAVFSVTMLVED